MVADGLTKGRADRTALISMMHGNFHLSHPSHEYHEPSSAMTADSHHVQRMSVAAPPLRMSDAVNAYTDMYMEVDEHYVHDMYADYSSDKRQCGSLHGMSGGSAAAHDSGYHDWDCLD